MASYNTTDKTWLEASVFFAPRFDARTVAVVATVTVTNTVNVTQYVSTAPATQYVNTTPRQAKKATLRYRLKR